MKSVRQQLRELNRAAKGGDKYAAEIEAELADLWKVNATMADRFERLEAELRELKGERQ